MKKAALAASVVVVVVLLSACGSKKATVQSREFQAQDRIEANYEKTQPVPSFNYSQLRRNLTEIETAQAEGVQTTTFFFNLGERDPIQTCASIGAPIPTTDQITNPEQPLRDNSQPLNNGGGNLAVGQMEPTGVYGGASTGTYVMCIGGNGKPYADYWEGFVQTVFGSASWNYSNHTLQLTGPPSFGFSKGK